MVSVLSNAVAVTEDDEISTLQNVQLLGLTLSYALVWTCAGGVWILGYNGDISIMVWIWLGPGERSTWLLLATDTVC